ncbi:MAG: GNAT family N-acetyltransferase [Acidimicrobiales bacterium]
MIRLAQATDVDACVVTFGRAFAEDPVMRWLFPGDDEYATDGRAVQRHLVHRFLALGSLWCTDDAVAMAGWIPPGRPEPDEEAVPAASIDHPAERIGRLIALRNALAANEPPEPHWYLNILGTHPDWQRRGLGAALMAEVFPRSERDGVPCYLETESTELVAYYRSHGFEVRSTWRPEPDGPPMWGMIRPVGSAA